MGMPGRPPMGSPRPGGHGPFGDRAFRAAMVACVVLLVLGLVMMLGGEAVRGAGIAFVSLSGVGLFVGGAGLLLERYALRRAAARTPEPSAPPAHAEPGGRGNGRVEPRRRKER